MTDLIQWMAFISLDVRVVYVKIKLVIGAIKSVAMPPGFI